MSSRISRITKAFLRIKGHYEAIKKPNPKKETDRSYDNARKTSVICPSISASSSLTPNKSIPKPPENPNSTKIQQEKTPQEKQLFNATTTNTSPISSASKPQTDPAMNPQCKHRSKFESLGFSRAKSLELSFVMGRCSECEVNIVSPKHRQGHGNSFIGFMFWFLCN